MPGLPATPYSAMNPGDYPLNGSPFHVPPSYAQQQPQQHGTGQGSPGTPVESGSPHAMQHSPFSYTTFTYPSHSYPQYPQYPQPIMMYGHARAQPHSTQAGPSTTPSTSSKTTPTSAKRKSLFPASIHPIHDQLTSNPSLGSGHDPGTAAASDNKKRTKTQRACDSCRSRKIRWAPSVPSIDLCLKFCSRCDILPDADPPVCQHCKQSMFECTFFLPITETRFKKKKTEEEGPPEKESGRGTSSPKIDSQKGETRVFGAPSSLTISVSPF